MLRNRRTIIFTLLFPAAMFFAFGSGDDWNESVGDGNVAAYVMISMALYGAVLTAAAGGAMVALERALGWSRQLRLTPLNPAVYILMKVLLAMMLGAVAIADRQRRRDRPGQAVDAAARLDRVRRAHPGLHAWCSPRSVFRGLPACPGENAMQILGPGLALLSFLGNVFIPIDEGSMMWHVASFTPMFGVAEISRAPLTQDLPWYAVLNAVVWFAVFVAGAAWRMSKDTARV